MSAVEWPSRILLQLIWVLVIIVQMHAWILRPDTDVHFLVMDRVQYVYGEPIAKIKLDTTIRIGVIDVPVNKEILIKYCEKFQNANWPNGEVKENVFFLRNIIKLDFSAEFFENIWELIYRGYTEITIATAPELNKAAKSLLSPTQYMNVEAACKALVRRAWARTCVHFILGKSKELILMRHLVTRLQRIEKEYAQAVQQLYERDMADKRKAHREIENINGKTHGQNMNIQQSVAQNRDSVEQTTSVEKSFGGGFNGVGRQWSKKVNSDMPTTSEVMRTKFQATLPSISDSQATDDIKNIFRPLERASMNNGTGQNGADHTFQSKGPGSEKKEVDRTEKRNIGNTVNSNERVIKETTINEGATAGVGGKSNTLDSNRPDPQLPSETKPISASVKVEDGPITSSVAAGEREDTGKSTEIVKDRAEGVVANENVDNGRDVFKVFSSKAAVTNSKEGGETRTNRDGKMVGQENQKGFDKNHNERSNEKEPTKSRSVGDIGVIHSGNSGNIDEAEKQKRCRECQQRIDHPNDLVDLAKKVTIQNSGEIEGGLRQKVIKARGNEMGVSTEHIAASEEGEKLNSLGEDEQVGPNEEDYVDEYEEFDENLLLNEQAEEIDRLNEENLQIKQQKDQLEQKVNEIIQKNKSEMETLQDLFKSLTQKRNELEVKVSDLEKELDKIPEESNDVATLSNETQSDSDRLIEYLSDRLGMFDFPLQKETLLFMSTAKTIEERKTMVFELAMSVLKLYSQRTWFLIGTMSNKSEIHHQTSIEFEVSNVDEFITQSVSIYGFRMEENWNNIENFGEITLYSEGIDSTVAYLKSSTNQTILFVKPIELKKGAVYGITFKFKGKLSKWKKYEGYDGRIENTKILPSRMSTFISAIDFMILKNADKCKNRKVKRITVMV